MIWVRVALLYAMNAALILQPVLAVVGLVTVVRYAVKKIRVILCCIILCAASVAQNPDAAPLPNAPSTAIAQLPDAPSATQSPKPTTWEAYKGKKANFATFRYKSTDPLLRSNKQVFKSPTFLLAQGAMILAMVAACRNPRSGEDWSSEAPAVGAVLAMDYLSFRVFGGLYATGPASYATWHYAKAAMK